LDEQVADRIRLNQNIIDGRLLIVVFNLERHAVKAGPPVASEYIVVLSQRI
jgi:hypothetical protein